MATNETKYVTKEILTYYDTKIKTYIDDKVQVPQQDVDALEKRVDAVEVTAAVNTANVASNREDIDELEAAVIVLQEDDKLIRQDISDIKIALENIGASDSIKEYVDTAINELENRVEDLAESIPDTTDFVTRDELNTVIDDLPTKEDLAQLNTLVADVESSLEEKADREEIPVKVSQLENDKGYATETYVKNAIAEAELSDKDDIDLSGYATKDDLKAVQDSIPSITGLATETYVNEEIAKISIPVKVSELENDKGFITLEDIPDTDLSNYYTKDETNTAISDAVNNIDIPEVDLDGYATEQFVVDKVASIVVPKNVSDLVNDSGFITANDLPKVDLSNYYTKVEVDNLIPDTFLTEQDVQSIVGTAISDKVDRSELIDYAKKTDIPTKTSQLTNDSNFTTMSEVEAKGYLTQHQDISNLATKKELEEAIDGIDIPDVSGFIKEIPSEYVTESELSAKGYLTEHQSLTDYAKKTDIPDVSQFVTATTVNALINTKADNILFDLDMRVNNPVGEFAQGDSVQGMSIKEILTKLLKLVEYVPPADVLEGTPEAAIDIINNNIPSHMLTNSGEIVPNTYEYRTMTAAEGTADNQQDSFFYQIVDGETAIETGYHITTEYLDEGFLTVLIPETIEEFEVKVYDATAGDWTSPQWLLIENSDYTLDGYIAYTADPAYEIYEGIAIRIVIK